jgi:predicted transposase YbfD/YdcC
MSLSKNFLSYFSHIIDPRKNTHNKRHQLSDILVLTILASICGAETWTDVEEFGKSKLSWLKNFLQLPNGIPSHDTIGDLYGRICPSQLQEGFLSWVQSLVEVTGGDIIPIDGKTLRRSYDRAEGRGAIHMVSAWSSANGVVLGQVKTEEKSNEITAIPKLLGMLDITGCTVTIDAMGCQREIAKQIVNQGGDYVLALKGNQSSLYEDVQLYMDSLITQELKNTPVETTHTLDKGHGRIEERRYWVTEVVDWLAQKKDWSGLKSVGVVEATRQIGEKTTTERRYYVCSASADALRFSEAVRTHWSVENQLHWSLDVSFNEDQCRVRKDNAPENFAIIRHIALNMLKKEQTSKVGIKIKRNKAGWNNRYLAQILMSSGF